VMLGWYQKLKYLGYDRKIYCKFLIIGP